MDIISDSSKHVSPTRFEHLCNSMVMITLAWIWYHFYPIVTFLLKLGVLLGRAFVHCKKYQDRYFSYADVFEKIVDNDPDHVQFITVENDKHIKLKDIEIEANQIAHWGLTQKYIPGDTIALMMLSRPSVISVMVGMAKIGVATAMLNTNTTGDTFAHVVQVSTVSSKTKIVIIDPELENLLEHEMEILKKQNIKCISWSELTAQFEQQNSKYPKIRPSRKYRLSVIESDPLIYIFTSGTTGLPKSSKISHTRFHIASLPYATLTNMQAGDCMYCALPLYHSAGLMLGTASAIGKGGTVVLRRKFSSSQFCNDCVKYNVVSMQYIGELCRYLLNTPVNEALEKQLKVKYAFGNGLSTDIWSKFQNRFNILHIVEIYGATEGNCNLINGCDVVGACGFVPRILDALYPLCIVLPDPENLHLPYRDPETGKCVPVKPDAVGLLIGKITNNDPTRRFEGYTDSKATQKKVLKNVFEDGDAWFNSGDLLSRDYWGYFYWSDRTGDTFRWKGENVATTEIEQQLSQLECIADCAVYGVKVPKCDGKAGMAAIMLHETHKTVTDDILDAIAKQVSSHLPSYSRPLFIRFDTELVTTATFKHIKSGLVADSFDPSKVLTGSSMLTSNAMVSAIPATTRAIGLYVYKHKENKYVPMTSEIFLQIQNGNIQL